MTTLPRLHAVTNDEVLQRPDFLERARFLYRELGDQVAVHLRARYASARTLYELAVELRAAGTLFVNDRVDLAIATRAHGVHLRADSMSIAEARALVGPDLPIGRSCHALPEAQAAERAGANYVFLGTIFESRSHPKTRPMGTERLREVASGVEIPVIAIGGIDAGNAGTCLTAGSYGVAVVTAAWAADHPAIRALVPPLT